LEKPLLGWDVGTFEFTSDSIVATGVDSAEFGSMKLKLRTGGSTGQIGRSKAKAIKDGVEWPCIGLRLPVRNRYMSPVVFEFRSRGVKNNAGTYALVWLPTIVDNETIDFKLPIYKAENYKRIIQNFIHDPTQETDLNAKKIGFLEFKGRFKAGLDEDHANFLSDNDHRETLETYEACVHEGLREGIVKREVGPAVETLAAEAYGEAPDVDSDSDIEDPANPTSKSTGTRTTRDTDGDQSNVQASKTNGAEDWNNAFGNDPSCLVYPKGRRYGNVAESDEDDDSSEPERNSGIIGKIKEYKENEKDLHRKHRGAMQWKPIRTMKAVKDQMKVGAVKAKTRFSMTGREPDVEV